MNEKKYTIEELVDEVNKRVEQMKVQLNDEPITKDGRQSRTLSVRRIRDYITKGLLDKPYGMHHNKYFTKHHVDQLISLRTLMHVGISDTYIMNSKSSSDYYVNEATLSHSADTNKSKNKLHDVQEIVKSDAMDFLLNLKNNGIQSNYRNPEQNVQSSSAQILKSPHMSNLIAKTSLRGESFSNISSRSNVVGFDNFYSSKTQELSEIALSKLTKKSEDFTNYNEYVVDESLKIFLKMPANIDKCLEEKLLREMRALIKEQFNQKKCVYD